MSKRLIAILCLLANVAIADETRLGIGREITESDATSRAVSVLPSGSGLPKGKGHAREGRALYLEKCAACHGDNGEGRADFPPLVGGRGSLGSDKPLLTVGSYWPTATTLFDYVWRAMPYQSAGSLTPNEVYAITAWILSANDIFDARHTLDRESLLRVQMPNRDGFIDDPRPD